LNNRTERVSEEIKKEVSDIIRNAVRDPRLPDMLSVLKVDVSRDFSHAKVFYSTLAPEGGEKSVDAALRGAAGFIRRELGARLKLRRTPELHFVADHSIERVIGMNRLISETIRNDAVKYGKT
jgi:ribosome-binding factor A